MSDMKDEWNRKYVIKAAKRQISGRNIEVSYLVDKRTFEFVEPLKRYINTIITTKPETSPNTTYAICKNYRYIAIFFEMENKTIYDAVKEPILLSKLRNWLKEPLRFYGINISGLDYFRIRESEEIDELADSSINHVLSLITSIYKWMTDIGEIQKSPVPMRKVKKSELQRDVDLFDYVRRDTTIWQNQLLIRKSKEKDFPVISKEEYLEILKNCKSIRDKLIIIMLYEGGMRKGELLGIYIEDIDVIEGGVWIRFRPNNINKSRAKAGVGRDRLVSLDEKTLIMIDDYILTERANVWDDYDNPFLFLNISSPNRAYRGKPMTAGGITSLFNSKAKQAFGKNKENKANKHIYPHMMRHSNATNFVKASMRENGAVNWTVLSKHLGHQNTETTKTTYIHLTGSDIREEIMKHKGTMFADKDEFMKKDD